LTLPPLHHDVLAACRAAGWHAETYEGIAIARHQVFRYAGVIATAGDLRAHAEWRAQQPGDWQPGSAELAVRHPAHDRADFARLYPAAWRGPHPALHGRRSRLSGVGSLLQLLEMPPGILAECITAVG
jgi:hypothetical protein